MPYTKYAKPEDKFENYSKPKAFTEYQREQVQHLRRFRLTGPMNLELWDEDGIREYFGLKNHDEYIGFCVGMRAFLRHEAYRHLKDVDDCLLDDQALEDKGIPKPKSGPNFFLKVR